MGSRFDRIDMPSDHLQERCECGEGVGVIVGCECNNTSVRT